MLVKNNNKLLLKTRQKCNIVIQNHNTINHNELG